MIVGYARTSTAEQIAGLEAQQRDLISAGCDGRVFTEQTSSVGAREALCTTLDFVREGDTLVVTKIDRLARSTSHLLQIVEQLEVKNVGLRILDFGGGVVDTKSPTGKLMLTMFGAMAQFEREMMLERQREGIAKAKRDGKYKGRAPTARMKSEDVLRLKENGKRVADICAELNISRASVYRILKQPPPVQRMH